MWYYILPAVLKLINNIAVINKELTPYQALIDNLSLRFNNVPNLGRYKVIGAPYNVLIPFKKRLKSRKLALKIKAKRFLAVLSLKTFLIWIPAKKIVVKTPFIKLRKKALFKGKTAILKKLLPRERG